MRINTTFTRVRLEECIGKTIAGVTPTTPYSSSLGLRFSDGTYFYVRIDRPYGDDDALLDHSHSTFDDGREPFELGIIDEAERDRLLEADQADRERIRRKQYESLKAEFEKGPDPT